MDAALSIIRWPSGAGRYRHGKVVIYVSALALQSRIVAFTCSYSHYFQDWRYEDLTVTNSAFFRAFCGTDNRLDDLFFIGFLNHRRDHRLWQRGPCSRAPGPVNTSTPCCWPRPFTFWMLNPRHPTASSASMTILIRSGRTIASIFITPTPLY